MYNANITKLLYTILILIIIYGVYIALFTVHEGKKSKKGGKKGKKGSKKGSKKDIKTKSLSGVCKSDKCKNLVKTCASKNLQPDGKWVPQYMVKKTGKTYKIPLQLFLGSLRSVD